MSYRWIIVSAILLMALLVQMPVVLNADLSCLLTEGEKVLDGGKLGVDVFELNPPLSVYLYMPALQLARITGIAPRDHRDHPGDDRDRCRTRHHRSRRCGGKAGSRREEHYGVRARIPVRGFSQRRIRTA
ncbi:hypothetical protein J2R95_001354 [Bradyrhizobium japonicum]|nr:hypothetical protein [Bradyrhizobium japonicum]